VFAFAVAKIGRLIPRLKIRKLHVQPNARVIDLLRENLQIVLPKFARVRLEPIGVVRVPGPDLADEETARGRRPHENVLRFAPEDHRVEDVRLADADVQNRHVLDLQLLRESVEVALLEELLVDRENLVALHVVDVGPDRVERDVPLSVLLHDVDQALRGVVAPPRLVVPEGPAVNLKRLPEGRRLVAAEVLVVEFDRRFGPFVAQEEFQVEAAAHGFEIQQFVLPDDVHWGRVFEKYYVEVSGFFPHEVHGMRAVNVLSEALAVVDYFWLVPGHQGVAAIL
jgi:hypothetical protein